MNRIRRFAFFTVPVADSDLAEQELNSFLAQHRVVSVDCTMVADGTSSFWAISVRYRAGSQGGGIKKAKIDYRDVLSAKEFAAYVRLRDLRKTMAEQEGVPPYALFTNEQLATMVRREIPSIAALAEISGVGPAKVEKYGAAFVAAIKAATKPDTPTESSPDGQTPPDTA